MKLIAWQVCTSCGAIGNYPPESGKMLNPEDNVVIGMKVSAIYKELTVMLEIKEEIDSQVFSAIVLCFEPVSSEQPTDPAPGEEVMIKRENICWLFA
ncbi:MAG: hypothetical protein ACWGKN_14145 [Desulfoprunum sp.]|jgi:hypothetical protein